MIMPQVMHQELLDYIAWLESQIPEGLESQYPFHRLYKKNIFMASNGYFYYIHKDDEPGRKH
jgi:hypothetical protein|tara:strand:+ start:75 stop:260 length:186 start_codon:yes stop_codon:yes gene_type:complete